MSVIFNLFNLIFDLSRRLSGQQKQQAAQSEEIEEQGDEEGEYEDEEEVWIYLNSRLIFTHYKISTWNNQVFKFIFFQSVKLNLQSPASTFNPLRYRPAVRGNKAPRV